MTTWQRVSVWFPASRVRGEKGDPVVRSLVAVMAVVESRRSLRHLVARENAVSQRVVLGGLLCAEHGHFELSKFAISRSVHVVRIKSCARLRAHRPPRARPRRRQGMNEMLWQERGHDRYDRRFSRVRPRVASCAVRFSLDCQSYLHARVVLSYRYSASTGARSLYLFVRPYKWYNVHQQEH